MRSPSKQQRAEAMEVALRQTAAVVKLQRAYRQLRMTYLEFGPSIFCTAAGERAPYGKLLLTRGVGQQRIAPWITVDSSSKMTQLCHFVERYWKLPTPDLVIDVAGCPHNFSIDLRIADIICDGLDQVIRSTSCWMMTSGFDAGLPRLVGSAVRKSGLNVPVIGMAPWNQIRGRDPLGLDSTFGTTVTYNSVELGNQAKRPPERANETAWEKAREAASAPISPDALHVNGDHTHFIFADHAPSGRGMAQGYNTDLRARFVDAYTDRKHLPVVMLVVQGDVSTLDAVLVAARGSTPILIVVGSGGAADAINRAVFGDVDDGTEAELFEEERARLEELPFRNVQATLRLAELKRLHEGTNSVLVTAFDWQNDEGDSLSTVMLEAMVRMKCRPQVEQVDSPDGASGPPNFEAFAKALKLAINWDRIHIARSLIEGKMINEEDRAKVLALALQRAIERQRASIVELLLDSNAPLERVNLVPLYNIPDRYNFLVDFDLRSALGARKSNVALRGIAEFLGDITPLLEQLCLEGVYAKEREEERSTASASAGGGLAGGGLAGGLGSVTGGVADGLLAGGGALLSSLPTLGATLEPQPDAARDIFFWSVICGHDDLARVVWQRCTDPLHLAILGSFMSRVEADRVAVGQQEVRDRAERLEGWASGALETAPTTETAYKVLSSPAMSRHLGTLLDLGLECEMKNFLSHRHCLSLMSNAWIGAYDGSPARLRDDFSPLTLVLCTLCPVLFPFLLEDADKPVWDKSKTLKSAKKITSLVKDPVSKLAAAKRSSSVQLSAVIKAQVTASQLAMANKSRAVHSASGARGPAGAPSPTDTDTMGRVNSHASTATRNITNIDDYDHPLGADAKREAEIIAGIRGGQRKLSEIVRRLFFVRTITHLLAFYHIPAVKFVTRSAVHIALLTLHFIVLSMTDVPTDVREWSEGDTWTVATGDPSTFDPPEPWEPASLFAPSYTEYALGVLFVTIFLDRRHRAIKIYTQQQIRGGGGGGGDGLWTCATLLYTLALALRLGSYLLPSPISMGHLHMTLQRADLYRIYQGTLAINTIFVCLCSLPLLSLSPAFGTLTIVLRLMVRDVMLWSTLFIVIVAGFIGAFIGFSRAGFYHQLPAPDSEFRQGEGADDGWMADQNRERELDFDAHVRTHPVLAVLWMAFGEIERSEFSVFTDPITLTFSMIMGLGMSNLLVAMFADSYVNVQSNAKVEYNYLRFQRISELHDVLMRTPPPFNVLFVLWDLLAFFVKWVCSRGGQQMNTNVPTTDGAEALAHRLVELYVEGEDAAAEASLDGVLQACRAMLQEERAASTSRFVRLAGLTTEMHSMLTKVTAGGGGGGMSPAAAPTTAASAGAAPPPTAAPAVAAPTTAVPTVAATKPVAPPAAPSMAPAPRGPPAPLSAPKVAQPALAPPVLFDVVAPTQAAEQEAPTQGDLLMLAKARRQAAKATPVQMPPEAKAAPLPPVEAPPPASRETGGRRTVGRGAVLRPESRGGGGRQQRPPSPSTVHL